MKEGFRVYDTDTHIDPGADVLEKYVDPGFRTRLDDLAPFAAPSSRAASMAASATPIALPTRPMSAPWARPNRVPDQPTAVCGAARGGPARG